MFEKKSDLGFGTRAVHDSSEARRVTGKTTGKNGETPPLTGELSSTCPEPLFGGEQSGNGARSLENEVSEVSLFGDAGDGSGSGGSRREAEGGFLRREATRSGGKPSGKRWQPVATKGKP